MKPRLLIACALVVASCATFAAEIQTLPNTKPIEWPEADLSGRLMDGAHQFIERKIAEAPQKRARYWKRDFSSPDAYARSVDPNREHLRTIIGASNPRLPARMERYGDDANPALVAETSRYRIFQVRWPVFEGLNGCGLLVEQKREPVACAIVLPDADQTPERALGLAEGIAKESQGARWLAENGFELLIPTSISRQKLETDDKQLKTSDQTHREWIYRQAFHMGRHVIGYEAQIAMAGVDWLRQKQGDRMKIGICGYAEGGLIAFYTAAIDPRINAALVSGYFDSREKVWAEPIYRNVWSLLREFGDAEIASLILPRGLVIEHSEAPTIEKQKGDWRTPDFESVAREVKRIENGPFMKPILVRSENGGPTKCFSQEAVGAFAKALGLSDFRPIGEEALKDKRARFDSAAREFALMREMENYTQTLVRNSEKVRNKAFLYSVMPELADSQWSTDRRKPTHSAEKFIAGAKRFREQFLEEEMGRFDDEPMLPFNARTRKVAETNKWTAYDVVLDVYPELFAWGVLVLPKDLKPGERRPVVVCQHGRNGIPRDTIDGNTTAYNNFAAVLAEQGFITFAPHNLYRGEDRYRWLDRKANTVKATLFTFIIAQHDQILRWLATLPNVDGDRIAFYGLSYGGETAVRVPAVLEKYCLSICSGDFNQWTRKVASTDEPFSFMRSIEWEMPYWNLGQTFDYAEMTYLIFPRPFMVERGHLDRVGVDSWVS
jgi:dienelactone hydrolase